MAAGTTMVKKVSVITGITRAPQGPFSGPRDEETRVTRWRRKQRRGDRRSCYSDTKSRPTRKSARVSQPDARVTRTKWKHEMQGGKSLRPVVQWHPKTWPVANGFSFSDVSSKMTGGTRYMNRGWTSFAEKIVASVKKETVREEFCDDNETRIRNERDKFLWARINKNYSIRNTI